MLAFGVHFGEQGLRSIIILEVLFGFKHVFLLFFLEVKYQVLEVWLQNPGGPISYNIEGFVVGGLLK